MIFAIPNKSSYLLHKFCRIFVNTKICIYFCKNWIATLTSVIKLINIILTDMKIGIVKLFIFPNFHACQIDVLQNHLRE